MKQILALFIIIFFSKYAFASELRFVLDGEVLFFDSDILEAEQTAQISWVDVENLETILADSPNIRTLNINSSGGSMSAARYMSDLVIDYDLDVNISGTCESACTLIFLGGNKGTIDKGSWLGFHQTYWGPSAIEAYYNKYKSDEGWNTPFEYTSWVHEDTQNEILDNLKYFIERGISADFAIRTMQAKTNDMWYPRRKELIKAGVIKNKRD